MQPEIERYKEDGLIILMAASDSKEVTQSVLDRYGLDVVVLDDRDGRVRQLFEIRGVPTGVLYDREGNLVETTVGWHQEKSLPLWIEKVEAVLYE